MPHDDIRFRILRLLEQNPEMSQRDLAATVGIGTGSTHYMLKALVDRDLVKLSNFTASEDKRRYAYVLTPKGIAEREALTFKENCPDLRNTRVVDVVGELSNYGISVEVHDPQADPKEARAEYDVELVETPEPDRYDAIVLAINHAEYREMGAAAIRALSRPGAVLFDVKSAFARDESDGRL